MQAPSLNIYVGCSLTLAPPEFCAEVEEMKKQLGQRYEILEFLGTVSGTALDVYRYDIEQCVADADLFVAICDDPAIGLGVEFGAALWREETQKPILAVAHKDRKVSRMVPGLAEHYKFPFLRYEDMVRDVPTFVDEEVARLGLMGAVEATR